MSRFVSLEVEVSEKRETETKVDVKGAHDLDISSPKLSPKKLFRPFYSRSPVQMATTSAGSSALQNRITGFYMYHQLMAA